MRGKELKEKGITLIALVITVVILIILATVTLNVVLGEGGLIQRAQQAKELTEQVQKDEEDELKGAEEFINGVLAGKGTTTTPIEEAKPNPSEDGPRFEDTTTITDDLENEVKIPGGFHLDKDSGTKVEEGIVIEDDSGNQFVWIPVGEYKVSDTINSAGKLTNELSRRTFTESGSTAVNGDDVIEYYYYGEGNENSVAKDQIEEFKTSATNNKGFYIGRYEAGTEIERTASTDPLTTPLVQANKYPYNYVTRDEAKQQAEVMYSGNKYVTSELISGYAWDTALNFICQTNEKRYLLATTTDSTYGNIGTNTRTLTGEYTVEGEISDKYSNVFDLLGNLSEWTTEYSSLILLDKSCPWVGVGGNYSVTGNYAAIRNGTYNNDSSSGSDMSFRCQLYLNN